MKIREKLDATQQIAYDIEKQKIKDDLRELYHTKLIVHNMKYQLILNGEVEEVEDDDDDWL